MSALFLHRPPICERATDHTYTKGCSLSGKKCVGTKWTVRWVFSQERGYFKSHMPFSRPNFPPPPPPHQAWPLSLRFPPPLLFPPLPPPPKLRCFRGGQVSLYPGLRQGRALYRRVTYQICQEATDIYGGSEPWENAVGAQEAGDGRQRLLPPHPHSLVPLTGGWRQIGGWGGIWLGSTRGFSCAQLVPERRLLRIQTSWMWPEQ